MEKAMEESKKDAGIVEADEPGETVRVCIGTMLYLHDFTALILPIRKKKCWPKRLSCPWPRPPKPLCRILLCPMTTRRPPKSHEKNR